VPERGGEDKMTKEDNMRDQIKLWANELQEVRSQFAINISLGQAYRDLDRIINEMKEYSSE
jgi:hypothetical protein